MLAPPAIVRGLQVLQRELYVQRLTVPAARLPARHVGVLRGRLSRELILSYPRIKAVLGDSQHDASKRLLLLNPDRIRVSANARFEMLTETAEDSSSLWEEFEAEAVTHELVLDYDYWTADEILSATLPTGMDVPGSFETVGHIAHLNLRDEHGPFKQLIGAVILDKNPTIRTVVNKVGAIEATFRFFQMEVLAGEEDMEVEVREEGCVFVFDYSTVYWNSRLQHEHRRLVSLFPRGSRVCDMFCGVGPFALPAAKKGCIVYANDLNPESVKYLALNRARNKIPEDKLRIYNMDARDFVSHALQELNGGARNDCEGDGARLHFDHYIMNLPASAHEFLDAFGPVMATASTTTMPIVHCYVFCRADASPVALVETHLGAKLEDADTPPVSHFVRNVAPNKDMYCVSFSLPRQSAPTIDTVKRQRIE